LYVTFVCFVIRVAKVWNKLPDQVINAPSTNAFKNRLDKYWENEEIYYSDHRAEISGGNQSDIQLQEKRQNSFSSDLF
jgi:hypothetical protein